MCKLWAIEEKEAARSKSRNPKSPKSMRSPVPTIDNNRNLKMQLRITKKTLEAEK